MTMALDRKSGQQPEQRRLDDYVGWKVQGNDGGKVGKVSKATYDTDREHFVVKTSPLSRGVVLHADDIVAAGDGTIRLGIGAGVARDRPKYVQQRGSAEQSAGGNHVIPL